MTTSPDYTEPIGPYFDFTARSTDLARERDINARIAAKRLLAGDLEHARYFASEYARFQAKLDALHNGWEELKASPSRWVGFEANRNR